MHAVSVVIACWLLHLHGSTESLCDLCLVTMVLALRVDAILQASFIRLRCLEALIVASGSLGLHTWRRSCALERRLTRVVCAALDVIVRCRVFRGRCLGVLFHRTSERG